MSATRVPTPTASTDGRSTPGPADAAREYANSRESKPGFMTSEFISSMVAAAAILIAAAINDGFSAEEAWPLVAFLSIGYMISRGLAKAGVTRGRTDH